MKTRCPNCGTTVSLDALIAHDAAREALAAVFKLSGSMGGAMVRYLGLFRPGSRDLTMDRVAKLLSEVLPDIEAQRIQRNHQVFEAPHSAWIWAIEQTLTARDNNKLKLPLKGHGFLYEVITTWRPQATALITANAVTTGQQSKMAAGLSALENFKHGK